MYALSFSWEIFPSFPNIAVSVTKYDALNFHTVSPFSVKYTFFFKKNQDSYIKLENYTLKLNGDPPFRVKANTNLVSPVSLLKP